MTRWYPHEALSVLNNWSSMMVVFCALCTALLALGRAKATLPRPAQLSCYDLCYFPRVVCRVIKASH